jgi:hypothetical protein
MQDGLIYRIGAMVLLNLVLDDESYMRRRGAGCPGDKSELS